MSQAEQPVVWVQDVVKDFRPGFGLRRKRVLDGISFSVRRGEIFGFVGPNGSGKTTTLKVLLGLIYATSGEAAILGHRVRETAFRRDVGFLPENPYFYDFLTGREILHFYARLSGVSGASRARARRGAAGARLAQPRRRCAAPHLLEGDAPAHRHRPGAGPRSAGRVPRRADERARSDSAARRSAT